MPRKTIALPGLHDLDIGPVLPIVDSKPFQRLRYIKQLGIAHLVFPCAQHTRFEHSLGVYSITLERAARWERDNSINKDEAHNLGLYGLLHDIGHGVFSHDLEPLCAINHKQHGLAKLDEIRKEIEACGGDPTFIKSLFAQQNLLSCCVSHSQLGTDKIDYLLRDAEHTTQAIQLRVGDLLNHVHLQKGRLVAERHIIAEVAQALWGYVQMYDRVYFRKPCLVAKRFLQKIVSIEMKQGNLEERHIWELDDDEMSARLLCSRLEKVRVLFERLRHRKWPKVAVVLTLPEASGSDRLRGKAIANFRVPLEEMQPLDKFRCPHLASQLEAELAELTGIPEEALLVVPVVDLHRFLPEDVPICDGDDMIGTLKELRPEFFGSLEEIARDYIAVRVCALEEHRAKLAEGRMATRIRDYLLTKAK